MNWPEALTAITFMFCATSLVIAIWMLRRIKAMDSDDFDEYTQRLRAHGLTVTQVEPMEPFRAESVSITEEFQRPTVHSLDVPETDHDRVVQFLDELNERVQRLEKR